MCTRRRARVVVPALALIFALVGVHGCSSDDSPTAPTDYDASEYMLALPTWEEFSPPRQDEEVIGDPLQEIDWDEMVVCSRTPCSLTATPEDVITYNPGSEILYLGSLIQGKSYAGGMGALAELPIRERAPLTLTIDLHTTNSSRTVENPNAATVGDAIHDLVAEAATAGHTAGSSIYFSQTTSHSVDQSMLSLGMSARYMGASVRASLSAQATREETSIAAYFIQRMFTTSLVLPSQPGDFFSSSLTREKLDTHIAQGRIGPDNLPVFVSNIVWGRMMVLTMTSTLEASRMRAALQASYAGISGSVGTEHLEVLQQSTIKLVTVGGDAQAALNYLQSGNLGSFFEEDAPLTTAVPLSYTLRNLADPDYPIAKVSETTSYDLMECGELTVLPFSSEPEWRNEVLKAGFDLVEWPTTRANVGLASELSGPPGNNAQLTSPLTWEAANTGFSFDFYLSNLTFAGPGALVYRDQEMPECADCISVGDVDDLQNDDFEIGVTGTAVYAMAFQIIDNNPSGEDMEIWGATGESTEEFLEQWGGRNGFVGLISPVPLRRIKYNEDAGGDDIALAHFRFATGP